jgi:uncharacterized membrane protein
MALLGRLHPLIVHFPIALVIVAAVCEVGSIATGRSQWRTVAVFNVRAGAGFAVAAATAGWRLASSPAVELTPLLEWHRWLGALAALSIAGAAAATWPAGPRQPRQLWTYWIALFCAASLVAGAGHSGGLLVWGADFLRL